MKKNKDDFRTYIEKSDIEQEEIGRKTRLGQGTLS